MAKKPQFIDAKKDFAYYPYLDNPAQIMEDLAHLMPDLNDPAIVRLTTVNCSSSGGSQVQPAAPAAASRKRKAVDQHVSLSGNEKCADFLAKIRKISSGK